MRGISFAAVDTGKPLHVPRVNNHGNIQFWNPDREEEDRDGSFVVVPLKVSSTSERKTKPSSNQNQVFLVI